MDSTSSPKQLVGYTLLLVEDSRIEGSQIATILRRQGATVEWVASVHAAQGRLGTMQPPDLVLIDHDLISDIGTTLALWMREQPTLQQVLRVSLSAQSPSLILASVPDTNTFHLIITKGQVSFDELSRQLATLIADNRSALRIMT